MAKRKPTDEEQMSILSAALEGDVEAIKEMASNGVDVGATSVDHTPVHYAAEAGNYDFVACLVGYGANVNEVDFDNKTPLHFAAKAGHDNIVSFLLNHGASINEVDQDKSTALSLAAFSGHTKCVITLLKNGADPSIKDLYAERTPLEWAAKKGHSEIVYHMVNDLKMDITKFDDETQQEINTLMKEAKEKQGSSAQ